MVNMSDLDVFSAALCIIFGKVKFLDGKIYFRIY
jgi:hypothetical protein